MRSCPLDDVDISSIPVFSCENINWRLRKRRREREGQPVDQRQWNNGRRHRKISAQMQLRPSITNAPITTHGWSPSLVAPADWSTSPTSRLGAKFAFKPCFISVIRQSRSEINPCPTALLKVLALSHRDRLIITPKSRPSSLS